MSYKSLIGKQAPAISLPDHNGDRYGLIPGENGTPIALFFYPKSGSIGCTREACLFRDAIAEEDIWKGDKVKVIGISGDPVAKQKKFVEKQKLTYPILSDETGEAREAYRIGKNIFGDARVSFIIDGQGIVRDTEDSSLVVDAHAKFVTRWLRKLQEEEKATPQTEEEPSVRLVKPAET